MQDLQRESLRQECVVLVGCLQELIVIAVSIETDDARDIIT